MAASLRFPLLFSLGVACVGPEPPTIAIVDVTVVDPASGRAHPDMTLTVGGRTVRDLGPTADVRVPGTTRVIDGRGKYLVPGLWDMHVHALWDPAVQETFLPLFVANGVTGIRDMGGPLEAVLAGRAAVRSGELVGPRIVAAGPILDGPEPVHPSISWAIGTAREARAAVDSLRWAGVDFIKVYTLLPRDAFFAVAERAREFDLPFAGHVPADVDPAEAAKVGMLSIEHLRSELGGLCGPNVGSVCDSLFAVLRKQRTWNTPTLIVRRASARGYDSSVVDTGRLRFIPPIVRDDWDVAREKAQTRSSDEVRRLAARTTRERELAEAVYHAQLKLLAGSDAGDRFSFPGFSLHDELVLLVEAGLSPRDALASATSHPATALGVADSLGTLARGMLADMVLLDANPLEDIRNTRRISAVILNGRLFDRVALDALLERIAAAASR